MTANNVTLKKLSNKIKDGDISVLSDLSVFQVVELLLNLKFGTPLILCLLYGLIKI